MANEHGMKTNPNPSEEILTAHETLKQRNFLLQKTVAIFLQKLQDQNKSTLPTAITSAGTQKAAHSQLESQNAKETEKRYIEHLRSVKEFGGQSLLAKHEYDRIAAELQSRLDEKEAKLIDIQGSFLAFKREIAQNSESIRTGKPVPVRLLRKFENAEAAKEQDMELIRLKNITLRAKLKKMEQRVYAKEQLAEGLHLIDFEQLKIENQSLNEKIEERNEELTKLRNKATITAQVLTHVKEKLQFTIAKNEESKKDLRDLETEFSANRDVLTKVKRERDYSKKNLLKLKAKDDSVKSEPLIDDYEKRNGEVIDLERRLVELQDRHSHLSRTLKAS